MKQYKIEIGGRQFDVKIESVCGEDAVVEVNGKPYDVKFSCEGSDNAAVARRRIAPKTVQAPVAAAQAAPVQNTTPAASASAVKSPLPGVILDVCVAVGDKVAAGTKLAVLEAMKMENVIEAEKAGTVTAVHVSKGNSVLEGEPIVSIE